MKDYPPEYINKSYIQSIGILNNTFIFVKISDLSPKLLSEMAILYASIFNADNKILINQYGFKGNTIEVGLWEEQPYTFERAQFIINNYRNKTTISYALLTKDLDNHDILLGGIFLEKTSIEKLKSLNRLPPFPADNLDEIWCLSEVFKRKCHDQQGQYIRGLSTNMLNFITNKFKEKNKNILIYSSTNNPKMKKVWEKSGWTVVSKQTSFGNKYQAFYKI